MGGGGGGGGRGRSWLVVLPGPALPRLGQVDGFELGARRGEGKLGAS